MPRRASRGVSDFPPNAARPALRAILGWRIAWVQVVQRNHARGNWKKKNRIARGRGQFEAQEREGCQGRGPCTGQRCSACSSRGPYGPSGWPQGPVAAQAPSQRLAHLTWMSPAAGAGLAGRAVSGTCIMSRNHSHAQRAFSLADRHHHL